MRFLIDASLPRRTAELVQRYGHEPTDVRDIGLGAADDPVIAEHARTGGLALLTADSDFGDIRLYPPDQYAGIVVVDPPKRAKVGVILGLVESLLRRPDILQRLPGRLAIIDPARIRLRPAS